tara:strand:- start:6228 stop:6482 length:255 start_codon:yes stop_codon:yes gene_type:complete
MKAVGNYIIIKEIVENIVKTDGGLELAEKHREDIRYRKGIIISSGPEILKEKDKIIFDKVAGHDIEDNKNVFKVITIKDVIAIL